MQVDGKARPDSERAFTRDALFAMDQHGLPCVSQWLNNSLVNQASFEQLQRTLKLGREALHSKDCTVQPNSSCEGIGFFTARCQVLPGLGMSLGDCFTLLL